MPKDLENSDVLRQLRPVHFIYGYNLVCGECSK